MITIEEIETWIEIEGELLFPAARLDSESLTSSSSPLTETMIIQILTPDVETMMMAATLAHQEEIETEIEIIMDEETEIEVDTNVGTIVDIQDTTMIEEEVVEEGVRMVLGIGEEWLQEEWMTEEV